MRITGALVMFFFCVTNGLISESFTNMNGIATTISAFSMGWMLAAALIAATTKDSDYN